MSQRKVIHAPRQHDNIALVLQGGGALGAYQAGVYEELFDTQYQPDWVAGVSIGAINAALIAGNPHERRIERLKEFWHLVSSGLGPSADLFSDVIQHPHSKPACPGSGGRAACSTNSAHCVPPCSAYPAFTVRACRQQQCTKTARLKR